MRTLKLVVDINRTADGHLEGRIQAPGQPAVPFSGRLELLRTIEHTLPAAEEAARTPRAPRVIGSTTKSTPRAGGRRKAGESHDDEDVSTPTP